VLSLVPVLRAGSEVQLTGHGLVINYGADKLRFVSPVPAGSKIHARRRLAGVERKSGGTLVTSETEVRVVGGEKPALFYRHLTLYLPAPLQQ
jgi:acyl dehydratase